VVDLSDLPDLPDAVNGPDVDDTVTASPMIEREQLAQSNSTRIGALVQQGVVMQDASPMLTAIIQNALLEEIVRHVAGDEAAEMAMLNAQRVIGDFLEKAEEQVRRAKLAAPGQVPGDLPNGPNRATRRRGLFGS